MATRDFSDKQEKRIAKDTGGKKVAGSGSTDFLKGDVYLDNFLIEAKTLTKPQKSHKVMKEWYTKAKEQSLQMRKDGSVVVFDFGDGEDIYSMDKMLFKAFYGSYKAMLELIYTLGSLQDKVTDTDDIKLIKDILRRNL